jgi:predicted phage terminase large subunit-like protein|tara:strand:- start:9146 stop:10603 length:1458 start_codon:yes stop_codon:yes gene_type:complete
MENVSSLESLDTNTLKLILKNALEDKREKIQGDFLSFVKEVWPEFVEGKHHKIYAEKLNRIANGELKRLIVNMPPRHTKSEFASNLFPAFFMGRHPKAKLIQTTHTGELAIRFGRKAKNLIESSEYEKVFPTVKLAADSKAAGRWESNHGGEYFAAGVGGAITGRGADLLIIDDPHSEQDALSPTVLESHYDWYTSGPRQRLQPGGAIVIVMTRWSVKDLTGKLLEAQGKDELTDKWEVVEFPAIINDKPMWGNFWSLKGLLGVKASIPLTKWQAQWMQSPTSEEGALIKREWWKIWEKSEIPNLDYIIQSYDTAFSKKETADYSAITTWGIFDPDDNTGSALILLDAKKGRWNFPELKKKALEEYKYWEPEQVIIEAKASGTPLTHELQKMGIPVLNFTPSKGNDKHSRVNSVSPLFESGKIWAPDEKFAEEVIEECAAFPFGDNDDYVDSTTQALMKYRQGYYVELKDDFVEESVYVENREYY